MKKVILLFFLASSTLFVYSNHSKSESSDNWSTDTYKLKPLTINQRAVNYSCATGAFCNKKTIYGTEVHW